jgi:prevent-host-death family protein
MIDPDNITSMTEFKRDTGRWMRRIRKTGKPGLLTVKGRAEAVIMDTASYRRIMEAFEQAEVVEAVQRSMREFEQGRGVPAVEALKKLRRRKSA